MRNVDIVIGGQYGSEGKGHIVSRLADKYDALLRVGGPNAGHSVYHPEHGKIVTYHVPAGCVHNPTAWLLIGPGAVIRLTKLLQEVDDIEGRMGPGFVTRRLLIHEEAMLIEDADVAAEGGLAGDIGSTRQGVGWATARRVLRTGRGYGVSAPPVRKMKDVVARLHTIGDTTYQSMLSEQGRVMLEGTQGTLLSLHHGPYPYVTSRDTTASGCLSEAGISPLAVDNIWLVFRTYPIRVQSPPGGTSGPMDDEISWEQVAEESGQEAEALRSAEMTTTTKRQRRVGRFEWDNFIRALRLNRPTHMALTFADYHGEQDRNARLFTQLSDRTRTMVHNMDEVARAEGINARVCLVSVGFGPPNETIVEV